MVAVGLLPPGETCWLCRGQHSSIQQALCVGRPAFFHDGLLRTRKCRAATGVHPERRLICASDHAANPDSDRSAIHVSVEDCTDTFAVYLPGFTQLWDLPTLLLG